MAKTKKEASGDLWLKALGDQKLEVSSARDALKSKGWLDTGNYALNWAVSGRFLGGYPVGHAVEVSGDSETGKSFLAARALAMAQAAGGVAMLDDVEGAYNLERVRSLGVVAERLAMRFSRTVTEHLQTTQAFLAAYKGLGLEVPGIMVCDSLAALSTAHELEVGLDKRDMTKAAELKAFFRIIAGELIRLPVVYLATNHTIANIGGWGSDRTTPGGGGPKFHSSVRVDLRATSKIKSGGEHTGVISRAVVRKNRFSAPWKEARLAIPFYQPVSRASGLVDVLLNLGLVESDGSHQLVVAGERTGIPAYKSKESFLKQDGSGEELLKCYPDLLSRLDETLAARENEGSPWQGAALGEVEDA